MYGHPAAGYLRRLLQLGDVRGPVVVADLHIGTYRHAMPWPRLLPEATVYSIDCWDEEGRSDELAIRDVRDLEPPPTSDPRIIPLRAPNQALPLDDWQLRRRRLRLRHPRDPDRRPPRGPVRRGRAGPQAGGQGPALRARSRPAQLPDLRAGHPPRDRASGLGGDPGPALRRRATRPHVARGGPLRGAASRLTCSARGGYNGEGPRGVVGVGPRGSSPRTPEYPRFDRPNRPMTSVISPQGSQIHGFTGRTVADVGPAPYRLRGRVPAPRSRRRSRTRASRVGFVHLPPGEMAAGPHAPMSARDQGLASTGMHTDFLPGGKKSPFRPGRVTSP